MIDIYKIENKMSLSKLGKVVWTKKWKVTTP